MRKIPYIFLLLLFAACNTDIIPIDNPIDNPNDSIPQDSIPKDTAVVPGADYIFDIEAIPVITIEITTTEWNHLLTYFDKNKDNEEYVKCNFTFAKDGKNTLLSNCGLRLRGNTSRRRPEGTDGQLHSAGNPDWHHASFALNFKKFVKGQRLAGAQKINLKWFKDDSSYAREVYCYDLFERFGVWTAPQSSYCRLNIKIAEDAYTVRFGVYELVEPVDDIYLKNRADKFGDKEGNLWKANWGADFKTADFNKMGMEIVTLTQTYTPVYDYKSDSTNFVAAKTQLADFITNFNSLTGTDFTNWVTHKMDVELFLKTYAVNVMCGMWDDYWNNKNNFYFYFNSAGKFFFIPYDYDNTLGTSLLMNDSGIQDVLNWGSSSNPLVKKLLEFPEYKALYVSYVKELANSNNDYFYADKSKTRIVNWQNKIKEYVYNDTGEDMTIEDKPANWGNCSFYRLLDSENNFFVIRAAHIPD